MTAGDLPWPDGFTNEFATLRGICVKEKPLYARQMTTIDLAWPEGFTHEFGHEMDIRVCEDLCGTPGTSRALLAYVIGFF